MFVAPAGGKQFRLEYKNCFALDLAKDGTGQVYNTKPPDWYKSRSSEMFLYCRGPDMNMHLCSARFSDKKKDLPGDIDSAIKALFELYDPAKKGRLPKLTDPHF